MLFRRVHDDVKTATSGQQIPFTYGRFPPRPSTSREQGSRRLLGSGCRMDRALPLG